MSDNRTKTNRDTEQKDKLVERLVAINRVTKVTKGGRTFTFAAIVVVGDEEGRIGFGLGKAGEVSAAIQKGGAAARRNLKQIPLHKGTIPHEQSASLVVLASSSSPLLPVPGLRLGVLCVPSWKVSA